MNKALEGKINKIISDAKVLASTHQLTDVYLNDKTKMYNEVWDEYARQINYTNKFKQMKKDLSYLLAILTETKYGVSPNTSVGRETLNKIEGYITIVRSLLKTYQEIDEGQWYILNYYSKGGGLQNTNV